MKPVSVPGLPIAKFFLPLHWVLALSFALHLAVGSSLGLTVDEAHYLLYAYRPALSYFDHPPLVGWLQWPFVAWGAPTALLRLLPGVLWVATLLVVHRLTLRLQPQAERAQTSAFYAVLCLALAPLLHLLGIGLLPDTLLMLWLALLMLQTLELMDASAVHKALPWLTLGVLLGLAGLSKYTAILPACAVAACLLAAHGWRLIGNYRLWLATGLALVLVAPVLVWNAQNDWVSFVYQTQHGKGGTWQALYLAQFLVIQVVAYGVLLWWGFAGWRTVAGNHRWLGLFFVVPFGVHAALSGGGSSLPHWTAPAWVGLAPFAGIALARFALAKTGKWWLGVVAAIQAVLCAGLMLLMLTGGRPLLSASSSGVADQPNPFADLHGWEQAGQRATWLAQSAQLPALAVQNWTLASRLGWYARPLPVYALEDRFDQFTIWAGEFPQGGNALLVDWSYMAYALPLAPHGFSQCQWLETMPVQRFGQPLGYFRFYACFGWVGAPQPLRLEVP